MRTFSLPSPLWRHFGIQRAFFPPQCSCRRTTAIFAVLWLSLRPWAAKRSRPRTRLHFCPSVPSLVRFPVLSVFCFSCTSVLDLPSLFLFPLVCNSPMFTYYLLAFWRRDSVFASVVGSHLPTHHTPLYLAHCYSPLAPSDTVNLRPTVTLLCRPPSLRLSYISHSVQLARPLAEIFLE